MGFVTVKCPACNVEIPVDDEQKSGFCSYCGAKLVKDNGSYGDNHKRNRTSKFIIISFVLILTVVSVIAIAIFSKSDAEKIVDRLEALETAYSQGDLEACIDCFDAKSRNAIKGLGTIGSGIGGSVGPFSFNMGGDMISALFSLGVFTQNEQIKFKVKRIVFSDKTSAKITADLWVSEDYLFNESTQTITINMIKEKGDWYIVEEFK